MSNRADVPVRSAPAHLTGEQAVCPNCSERRAGVVGRLGLRLLFHCGRCSVRFVRDTTELAARKSNRGRGTVGGHRPWA